MVQGKLGPRTDATSWTAEVQTHEHHKRRFVDPAFLQGPTIKIDRSTLASHEREYDPLLQRWRDDAKEAKQLALEEKERTAHLNRALDVQILREHPFHPTSHESRIEAIQKKELTRSIDMTDQNTMSFPLTCVDYNIISNLPFEEHHPGRPDERPRAHQREPRVRKKQGAQLRDFNIVSNRYLTDHEEKLGRDETLSTLRATELYRQRNRFDPVTQRYNEKDVEERHHCCDDAREVEVRMRAERNKPQCYSGRHTEHFDMVTHRADDEGTYQLKLLDTLEGNRKSRYTYRYMDEERHRRADIEFEDAEAQQRNEQKAHERFEETAKRGYDIVTNRAYGNGPHLQKLHQPYTVPNLSTWEIVEQNRSGLTPVVTPRGLERKGAKTQSITTQEVLESARLSRSHDSTQRSVGKRTPRMQSTPRGVLSEAGSASIASARGGRPPLLAMSGPPPPPAIPGSPVGSVYSRPRL